MKNYCKPELWTLKEISDALELNSKGNKKIVIPMFQRGKRWKQSTKDTFIDSLTKNYPIGTLLFYKTNEYDKEIYTLIDGLQRGSTIKEYLSKPTKFFTMNKISEDTRTKMYNLIITAAGNQTKQKEKVDSLLTEYIRGLKSYDDIDNFVIYDILSSEFPLLEKNKKEFNETIKSDLRSLKDDYQELCNVTIPAIVYTGDENTLPDIFHRINSQGVALTEYEIYAASWPSKLYSILNEQIVDYVLKKYDMLNDDEYVISGYNREEKRKSKTLNAFEYVFGLSKYLQNKYDSLCFYKNLMDDETNPVAFQLLNACFNSSHGQIKNVYKIINSFDGNIELLEKCLINSIEFVNACIEPVSKFKGNNRKNNKIFHSQYQIMSLISFAFRTKYDINNKLKVKDSWKEDKKILKQNILKYYVSDIITKYWGEGGTVKIHTANSENRYLISLSSQQLSNAFDTYAEDSYNRHETNKVQNPTATDLVILNTIYLNEFTALDQLSINKFDIEHIATKDQMKKIINNCQCGGLPISHIANLCFLPEFENRSKGANTLYQDSSYLKKSNTTIDIIETKYSFTKKDDLSFMNINYEFFEGDIFKSNYIKFLKNRSFVLKEKFLTSLHHNKV